MSKKNQIKQLSTNVPNEVDNAAHLMLIFESSVSFIKAIIKAPTIGRKIIKERTGPSSMLFIKEPS